jgi:hypothetical protein
MNRCTLSIVQETLTVGPLRKEKEMYIARGSLIYSSMAVLPILGPGLFFSCIPNLRKKVMIVSYTVRAVISRTSGSGVWLFLWGGVYQQNPKKKNASRRQFSTVPLRPPSLQWSHLRSNPAQAVRSQGIIP